MLIALALLTVPAVIALRHVRLDYDFEKFFPQNDPELDVISLFATVSATTTISDARDHQRTDGVRSRVPGECRQPGGTAGAAAHGRPGHIPNASARSAHHAGGRVRGAMVTARERTARCRSIPPRIWNNAFLRERFFNADASAMLVLMLCQPDLSKARSDSLLASVDRVIDGSGLPQVRKAGRIHGQQHYIALMEREMITFFLSSLVLLSVFLFIAFRRPWGVISPIAVVGLTVLWQVALMTALGHPLSILTMLLPTILFVVGMSDSVHIIERYIEALRDGHARTRALAITYAEVGLSTFITMLTTAIGYATLVTSGIQPMSEFGVFTALGVFMAYALSFTLLPAVLVLLPTPVPPVTRVREGVWDRVVHSLLRKVIARRRLILVVALGVALISALFIPRLKVNNFLLEDLPDSDPEKEGFLWFEREFGGVRPFEMEIAIAATAPTRPVDLGPRRAAGDRGRARGPRYGYGVSAILSPVTLLYQLERAANGGSETYARPAGDAGRGRALCSATHALLVAARCWKRMVTPDGRHARLTGRMVDEGGYVHRHKDDRLRAAIAKTTDRSVVTFDQTGMAFLIDRNNRHLSNNMLWSLGSSFLLIAAIMAWVFRSVRVVIVALVPNVIPLVFVAGLMGALGIDLKVSTAIIFSNAFGIAVDDTIHLLAKLRIELARGLSLPYALKRTYLSGGKAVIVMSIMLCAGFITLIASDFASVYYMGLLISITLGVALLAELFLLPVMVMGMMRKSER
jgi:predicted RND superfamily exporter protein